MPAIRIVEQPSEVEYRLLQLGIPLKVLQKAIERAFVQRNLCTENDPPFYWGMAAYAIAVRTLREELVVPGGDWRRENVGGSYCLVINDKLELNIAVANADAATGRAAGFPRTNSSRGVYTTAAIERNNCGTIEMFPETLPENVLRAAQTLKGDTWILLVHATTKDARGELSLPVDFVESVRSGNRAGRIIISDWSERIIIPNVSIDPGKMGDRQDDDSGPDIDIDVRLKP